jgi:probable HAF family extracellular repeat protein
MKINHCSKIQSLFLAAILINGLGLVTHATAQETLFRSFLADLNTRAVIPLGTLGEDESFASGINDAGQAVGTSFTVGGFYRAFITGPGGVGIRDLRTLGENYSGARDINNAGQVAGWFRLIGGIGGETHPFITGPDGMGMKDLGTLGGFPDYSDANGINERG